MLSLASWFGNMNQPVDIYCERTSAAWDAEPLNAISNIAFLFAAWAAWHIQKKRPNVALQGPIRALCIIIAVVGAGSLTFHTVATRWAEWADVIPILVFMIVYCWLILTVFFKWPFWLRALTTFAFFAATFFLASDAFQGVLWGGAMYLPTLFFLITAGIGIWRIDADAGKAFFAAAGLFAISFTARTIDEPLCGYLPIGTHYFWHIFNAAVLFLLVRTIILHAPGGEEAASRAEARGSSGKRTAILKARL
ncbi:MAG: ceramidase domain-containing protein [Rhodomicrobium sp.]